MTFKEVDQRLLRYKRDWCREDYCAWWKRYGKNIIDLKIGYRARYAGHRTYALRLYRDGRVAVDIRWGNWFIRHRINNYNPFRNKWWFTLWRGAIILHHPDQDWEAGKLIHRYVGPRHRSAPRIYFKSDGSLRYKIKGIRGKTHKHRYIKRMNDAARPRKRGWYWARRARNLFLDRSKCKYFHMNPRPWDWWQKCGASFDQWRTPPARTFDCGCRSYRHKQRPFTKTVQEILAEQNATVRAAWMQMYGLEKFFRDAGASIVSKRRNYELLQLNTGGDLEGLSQSLSVRALKMVCPSTGTVHINMVPNHIWVVPDALNWMFGVTNFMATVGQQT